MSLSLRFEFEFKPKKQPPVSLISTLPRLKMVSLHLKVSKYDTKHVC